MLDLQRALDTPAIETAYRHFIEKHLAPLISDDQALCEREGATYAFVSVRKPGSRPAGYSVDELRRRMVCPLTKGPLEVRETRMFSPAAGLVYPVYREIPLLIPVYARIWHEQNRGCDDPSKWREFSY